MNLPSGPGIRIDSGIVYGTQITPYYDPLLAKIIAHGCNRAVAIRRMQSALANTRIDGLHTNIDSAGELMKPACSSWEWPRYIKDSRPCRPVRQQSQYCLASTDHGRSTVSSRCSGY